MNYKFNYYLGWSFVAIKKGLLFFLLFLKISGNIYSQEFKTQKTKIVTQLENTYKLDQEVRRTYNACVEKKGMGSEECKEQRKALITQDSLNQIIISSILDKYGWIPEKETSKKANKAFFYVIQHGPLAFQLKYAAQVEQAFKRKQVQPIEYMFFIDRLNSKQGKAQIYGTQSETDNLGNQLLYPIKNWEIVNKLRKKMGISKIDLSKTPEYAHFPRILGGDTVVLIGHTYTKENKPIAHAIVLKGSTIIGTSNEMGLFIINIRKKPEEEVPIKILANENDLKGITQIIKGKRDFYDIYAQFN